MREVTGRLISNTKVYLQVQAKTNIALEKLSLALHDAGYTWTANTHGVSFHAFLLAPEIGSSFLEDISFPSINFIRLIGP